MSSDGLSRTYAQPHRNKRFIGWMRPDEALSPRTLLKTMLLPDENILQVGRISYGIYWQSFAFLIFATVVLITMAVFMAPLPFMILFSMVFTLKTLYMFTKAYLIRYYLMLVATDKRLICRYGIFNLDIVQLSYSKIESSDVGSTIAGRLFGYSTLLITGTGGRVMAIPFVINALEIRNTITEIISARDEIIAPTPSMPPEPDADLIFEENMY